MRKYRAQPMADAGEEFVALAPKGRAVARLRKPARAQPVLCAIDAHTHMPDDPSVAGMLRTRASVSVRLQPHE